MITTILVFACWILAGTCYAIKDTLAFKFKSSIFRDLNPDYWNPSKSWRNKYKNRMAYQGPAFIGSTTFLSFLTDAWHLFQFLGNSFLALSVVVVIQDSLNLNWWQTLLSFLVVNVSASIVYYPLYNKFFRVKK